MNKTQTQRRLECLKICLPPIGKGTQKKIQYTLSICHILAEIPCVARSPLLPSSHAHQGSAQLKRGSDRSAVPLEFRPRRPTVRNQNLPAKRTSVFSPTEIDFECVFLFGLNVRRIGQTDSCICR